MTEGLLFLLFTDILMETSLCADFTIVEEFEAKRERLESAHSLNLFCSNDELYPPSLLYKDQSRSVVDFPKVLFSLTLYVIGWN